MSKRIVVREVRPVFLSLAAVVAVSVAGSPAFADGDVDVVEKRGNITISGGGLANSIVLRRLPEDRIRIEGMDGTTVNGEADATIPSRFKRLRIALEGGNDLVELLGDPANNLFEGKVEIRTGEGDDTVNFTDIVIDRDLLIDSGDGNDLVGSFRLQIGRGIKFDLGPGDDRLSTSGNFDIGRKFSLRAGDGNDTILIAGGDFPRGGSFDLGPGDDLSMLTNSRTDAPIKFRGRDGLDTISVHSLNGGRRGNVGLFGDDGNDSLTGDGAFTGGGGIFNGGDGDDLLDVIGGDFEGKVKLLGGDGIDELRGGSFTNYRRGGLFSSGAGNDLVIVRDSNTDRGFSIKAGSGDDRIEVFDNSIFGGSLKINGSGGQDTLVGGPENNSFSGKEKSNVRGFEEINPLPK